MSSEAATVREMATNRIPPGTSFAYAVGIRTLDEQLRRIDALDSKAGTLLAADGLLAGILFATSSSVRSAPRWTVVGLVLTLFASLLLALLAFANRRYEDAPNPSHVVRFALRDEAWLQWRFMGNVLGAIDVNGRKLRRKARLLASSLVSLIAAVGLLGGYLLHASVTHRLGGT